MRISDWSSDVCSSDLYGFLQLFEVEFTVNEQPDNKSRHHRQRSAFGGDNHTAKDAAQNDDGQQEGPQRLTCGMRHAPYRERLVARQRSEEHTSELQSLMRLSYAVF